MRQKLVRACRANVSFRKCSSVRPEEIAITDSAIITLTERVLDTMYDPLTKLLRMFTP